MIDGDLEPKYILGGGSNVLFEEDYDGLIVRNAIEGIAILGEDTTEVCLEVGAGVIWQNLVEWCLDRDFGGIENLSLIPGTVGAAPIQNIGAYGVEFESVFDSLDALSTVDGTERSFSKEECEFSYRQSIFKSALKGKYIITKVRLKLTRKDHPLVLDYGQVSQELDHKGIVSPSIQDVSQVICQIRRSKLPDPSVTGNAGSFFKNPVVQKAKYLSLQQDYPEIPGYMVGQDLCKIPAAWMIEKCGWKGYRSGDVGVYPRHALVLVNYGSATGSEIRQLSDCIKKSVREKFGISIDPEVNIV